MPKNCKWCFLLEKYKDLTTERPKTTREQIVVQHTTTKPTTKSTTTASTAPTTTKPPSTKHNHKNAIPEEGKIVKFIR